MNRIIVQNAVFSFCGQVGEVGMKDEPNKITTTLKVVITGEFYDDEVSEETLRYCAEQDLEDAGFDVDVSLLKEQEAVVRCKDCMFGMPAKFESGKDAIWCFGAVHAPEWFCADAVRGRNEKLWRHGLELGLQFADMPTLQPGT